MTKNNVLSILLLLTLLLLLLAALFETAVGDDNHVLLENGETVYILCNDGFCEEQRNGPDSYQVQNITKTPGAPPTKTPPPVPTAVITPSATPQADPQFVIYFPISTHCVNPFPDCNYSPLLDLE